MIAWVATASAATLELSVREREDGDPIPLATVTVGALSAATDVSGRATLEVPDPGPWAVEVAADGFAPLATTIADPSDTAVVWLVRGGGAYEVVVEGLKPSADPTRHTVDGEMAEKTPGTLDDSVRLVQSLPGVTVQREYSPSSGDLSVRGSAPGDSRYYLDGVEIPYLYHYNQYASVFPATQVDQLDLYPSTFSAHWGDAVGAVIDARSRLDPPTAAHGGAQLNFVMGGADLRAPAGHGWWVAASGRRSYQDLAGEGSAQYTVWPTFYDFTVRAEHGDADNGFGLFTIGAGDKYTRAAGELDLLDPLEASTVPYLAYRQGFQVLGARGQWTGDGADGRVVGAIVHHHRGSDLSGLGAEDLDTIGVTSRLDATVGRTDTRAFDLGYEIHADRVGLVVDDAGPLGIRVAEEAPALARGVSVDAGLSRVREAAYGTAHLATGPVWWMPGVRLSADSTAPGARIEPRAAVRASLGELAMLKVGGGRYTQRPDSELLFEGAGDPSLPTTTSWQVSAGWEQAIAGRLELGVDLYRKWLTDPIVVPIGELPYAAPSGDAFGAELTTRYRLRELVYMWGWLAVQRTTIDGPDGETAPADGDQRLSGGFVLSWDVGRWNFGGRYRFASGLPFTPLEGSVYDAGTDGWVPIAGEPNAARLPTYHKVDLRVAYGWQLRGWSMELVLELWVVPRSSAQLYPTWNYDYTEQGWVVGPTFLPLLGARARF
ncbi:MAG: TonB-dependent receptor [Myxococcota bacterium]